MKLTPREGKILDEAAKLHADKTVNYIIRAGAIGFGLGILVMWLFTR